MARLIARVRVPLLFVVLLAVLGQGVFDYEIEWWVSLCLIIGSFVLYGWVGRVPAEPLLVEPPVRGEWRAVNSPASRVPSHGIHAYGQTYAVDLVFGSLERTGMLPAGDFPGFGRPIHAAAPGRVVRVRQGQRDHRGRTSGFAMLYLLAEGMLREVGGAGRVVGNHIVVDIGDGRYAVYAHLQRHSATVRAGDMVAVGQVIAHCGNSGNSSEPHLHFQLMDHHRPTFAAGIPFDFPGGVPRNGELLPVDPIASRLHP